MKLATSFIALTTGLLVLGACSDNQTAGTSPSDQQAQRDSSSSPSTVAPSTAPDTQSPSVGSPGTELEFAL